MVKFIISLAILASIFLAVTSQYGGRPYCRCPPPYANAQPICVPGPPPKDLKQGAVVPECYCDGPYYPVCSTGGWKESNVTSEVSEVEKIPTPSEESQELKPPPVCICQTIYKPVCACEDVQKTCKTFGNKCQLNCAKKTNPHWCYHHEGECGSRCAELPPPPQVNKSTQS